MLVLGRLWMFLVTAHATSTEMTDRVKTVASKATMAFWAKGTKKSMKPMGNAIRNSRRL